MTVDADRPAHGAKILGVPVRQELAHGRSRMQFSVSDATAPGGRAASARLTRADAQRRPLQGTRTARPWILPLCRSCSAALACAELILVRRQLDKPAVGERHQLDKLRPGADQIADDVALGDDHVDGRDADVLAVADDIIAAHRPRHLQALGRRALLADEIDDRLGALSVRSSPAPPRPRCRRPSRACGRRASWRAPAKRRTCRRR